MSDKYIDVLIADKPTREKIIEMAQGGGGALMVSVDDGTGAFDTTWQDIHDALAQGKRVIILYVDGTVVQTTNIEACDRSDGAYNIYLTTADQVAGNMAATATAADGYPVVVEG